MNLKWSCLANPKGWTYIKNNPKNINSKSVKGRLILHLGFLWASYHKQKTTKDWQAGKKKKAGCF